MGRVESILHKVVHNRANYYASLWDVKTALSAGIAALDMLDSAGREKAIKIANGLTEENLPTKPVRPPVSDAVDAIKYATVHYEMLGKEDKEVLDELRRILSPPTKPKKRRARGG